MAKNTKKATSKNSIKAKKTKVFTEETVTRCLFALVYPESAPVDWRQNLINNNTISSVIISPLHDKDTYTEADLKSIEEKPTLMQDNSTQIVKWGLDNNGTSHYIGEPKKPHWHVIIRRNYSKQVKYWRNWIESITNCRQVEPVVKFDSAIRYLAHYDQPEKHPYDVSLIETYGNCKNISLYFEETEMTSADFYLVLKNIVRDNAFTEFYELDDYITERCEDKWIRDMFQRNQSVRNRMDRYLTSKRSATYGMKHIESIITNKPLEPAKVIDFRSKIENQ